LKLVKKIDKNSPTLSRHKGRTPTHRSSGVAWLCYSSRSLK